MRAQFAAAPPGLTEQIVPKILGLTPQTIRYRRSAASKSANSKGVSEANAVVPRLRFGLQFRAMFWIRWSQDVLSQHNFR